MNIASCGYLLGLLIGFILVMAMLFSGSMIRNCKGIPIPPLDLLCGDVPMMVLSPYKGLRGGAEDSLYRTEERRYNKTFKLIFK